MSDSKLRVGFFFISVFGFQTISLFPTGQSARVQTGSGLSRPQTELNICLGINIMFRPVSEQIICTKTNFLFGVCNTQMQWWDGTNKHVTQWIIERLKMVSVWFQKTVRKVKTGHDMAGETTTPEGRQGGPERPRRRCFRGSRITSIALLNRDDLPGLNDPPSVRMMQPEWNSSLDDEGT